ITLCLSLATCIVLFYCFFFQAEDGIRDRNVTGVQTCALPISQAFGNLAHGHQATAVIGSRTVGKIEAYHIDTSAKHGFQHALAVAGWTQGGDHLGAANRFVKRSMERKRHGVLGKTRMARKSLTLVRVGPVIMSRSNASKKVSTSLRDK